MTRKRACRSGFIGWYLIDPGFRLVRKAFVQAGTTGRGVNCSRSVDPVPSGFLSFCRVIAGNSFCVGIRMACRGWLYVGMHGSLSARGSSAHSNRVGIPRIDQSCIWLTQMPHKKA